MYIPKINKGEILIDIPEDGKIKMHNYFITLKEDDTGLGNPY